MNDELEKRIAESRKILELKEDWDDEGSPAYSESTWQKAVQAIRDIGSLYVQRFPDEIFPIPSILNGPYASIDVFWTCMNHRRRILLNCPPDSGYAQWFCTEKRDTVASGSFRLAAESAPGAIVYGITEAVRWFQSGDFP